MPGKPTSQADITAPKYSELVNAVSELQGKLRVLQASSNSTPNPTPVGPHVDYRILPDVGTSIWTFTGHETSDRADDWISSVDGLAHTNQWPLRYRLMYVRSHVSEAARSWFLLEEFDDWDNFVRKFRTTFVRTIRKADLWRELESRVQSPNEPTIDYFYEKIGLCRKLDLSFVETRDYVLEGLRSQQQADWVSGRVQTDRDVLLSDIREWERLRTKRQHLFPPTALNRKGNRYDGSSTVPIVPKTPNEPKSVVVSREKPTSRMSGNETPPPTHRAEITCYNCRGTGHISRDCPRPQKPMKCTGCGSDRHRRSKCPATSVERSGNDEPGQAYQVDAASTARKPNPYLKDVMLNDVPLTGLVDTGCSAVLVRRTAATKCRLIVDPQVYPLYTVGNVDRPSVNAVGKAIAKVTVDAVVADCHDVRIVDDDLIPVDVMVGRTWLELPHVNYYKRGHEIVFETNSHLDGKVMTEEAYGDYPQVLMADCDANSTHVDPITGDDVKIGPELDSACRKSLLTLINKYRGAFAKSIGELGCTNVLAMDITEIENCAPVRMKPYKTSPTDRRTIAKILEDWKRAGIIADSTSAYASPVLLVNKANGEKRLCVDYRKLNQQTVTQPFPMPDVDSQLSKLADGRIFTTLDLSNGFLQIPLSEEAKCKTAFVTEETTARFERMPFGLKGAPATFQRLMSAVFKNLSEAGKVHTYLDDIIIPSKSVNDMLEVLDLVLKALVEAKLTLKPSKCSFGMKTLDYLGFRIAEGEIRPGPKIDALANFPRPRDAHEVRRFLGLAGYFRRFIVKYAEVAEPLTLLTAKDAPYEWREEQQAAFNKLKCALCAEPVVAMYRPDAEITEIHTDASSKALSGILFQGQKSTQLKMVYAVSKRTTLAESKYHSSRLELFAIIWTLNRLRQYLLGMRFTVVTDCQALVYLNIHKTTKPQIARWYEVFQEFDFEIKYRPGTRMPHVDALSRAPHDEEGTVRSVEDELSDRVDLFVAMTKFEAVRLLQATDERVRRLMEILNGPTNEKNDEVNDYQVTEGVLYKVCNGRPLLVVPKAMRKGIVIAAHDYAGHFSVDRTVSRILVDYWFPGLRRYVKQHIAMCVDCLVNKKPAGSKPGYLHPIPPGKRPFQLIHIDHLGPFETSAKKNKYLLVLVDSLTKYTQLFPCKTTNTVAVLRILDRFCTERGIPERIVSDRGTCFTSHAFETFCDDRGIRHTLNSTRHPQANGQVERANRTILTLLSVTTSDHTSWDTQLRQVENMLNTAPNKATTKTPYETLHGYLPRFHKGILPTLSLTGTNWRDPQDVQAEARESIVNAQVKMKTAHDRKRHLGIKYEVGEVVVMLKQPVPHLSTKLQSKYRVKPLQVVEVLPSDTYRVAEISMDGHETYATTAHVSQLKSWKVLKDDYDDPSDDDEKDEHDVIPEADNGEGRAEQSTVTLQGQNETGRRYSARTRKMPRHLDDYVN